MVCICRAALSDPLPSSAPPADTSRQTPRRAQAGRLAIGCCVRPLAAYLMMDGGTNPCLQVVVLYTGSPSSVMVECRAGSGESDKLKAALERQKQVHVKFPAP